VINEYLIFKHYTNFKIKKADIKIIPEYFEKYIALALRP